jgi:deoxyadenosine/deoxycytidine kinase
MSKYNLLKNVLNNLEGTNNIIVVERPFFTDKKIFAETKYKLGLMTYMEWNIYNIWYNYIKQRMDDLIFKNNIKVGIFYIHTIPYVCQRRVEERSRNEEKQVDFSYLYNLEDQNEKLYSSDIEYPICRVDGSGSIQENIEQNINEFYNFVFSIK